MAIRNLATALLLALAASAAGAQDRDLGGQTVVGKVQRLYVRVARTLYVEARPEDMHLGKELWADVRLAEGVIPDGDTALALIPEGSGVESGDLVEMRLARNGKVPVVVAPLAEINRVVGIAAKNPVLAAARYGK